mgnify:CR=1 FL=1
MYSLFVRSSLLLLSSSSFVLFFFLFRFEDLAINNGDQAGWRSWMGNGLYVDDGAHNIHAIRCSFYGCEKLGVFVGDIGTSVMVRVCMHVLFWFFFWFM